MSSSSFKDTWQEWFGDEAPYHGNKANRSVPGAGVSDGSLREFSPIPLTRDNAPRILAAVRRAVPYHIFAQLEVIASSAIQASERSSDKNDEVAAEYTRQQEEWDTVVRAPSAKEFNLLQSECQELIGREAVLRGKASWIAAKSGLRFLGQDLESLDACQAAIERHVHTEQEVRGQLQSARLKAEIPWWLKSITQASPLFLSVLTATGILKILAGKDLQSALESPMLPVALTLGLGLTLPCLAGATRYGWLMATSREPASDTISTARSPWGLVAGGFAVGIPALFLAGIDALAISALAADLAGSDGVGNAPASLGMWLPLIGCAFMGAATISKVWNGYCDGLESFQDEQVCGIIRSRSDDLRSRAAIVIGLVAEADRVASRLTVIQPKIEELSAKIAELRFEPELPEELLFDKQLEDDVHRGESDRFWAVVWSSITESTRYTDGNQNLGHEKAAWWKRLLWWRR